MPLLDAQDVGNVLAGASSTSEALEAVCVHNVGSYVATLGQLSTAGSDQTIDVLMRTIQQLTPTKSFATAFGDTTMVSIFLLFVPAVLFRAATLLAFSNSDMLSSNGEWRAVSLFLLTIHRELLASPGQRVVRVNALPPLPKLSNTKRTPSLCSIFTPSTMADVVPLPPSAAEGESMLGTSSFGIVLYTVTCGLSHLMQAIIDSPRSIVQGAGTLAFLKEVMRVVLAPTVVIYGSKETNLQTATSSLLVLLKGVLATRAIAGEERKEPLLAQWPMAMQCWFDLAIQSDNLACMQILLPYMLSFDTGWNM